METIGDNQLGFDIYAPTSDEINKKHPHFIRLRRLLFVQSLANSELGFGHHIKRSCKNPNYPKVFKDKAETMPYSYEEGEAKFEQGLRLDEIAKEALTELCFYCRQRDCFLRNNYERGFEPVYRDSDSRKKLKKANLKNPGTPCWPIPSSNKGKIDKKAIV